MLELVPPGAVDVKLEDFPHVYAWMDNLKRLPKWAEVCPLCGWLPSSQHPNPTTCCFQIHDAMLKIVQKRMAKL